jgi:hypothetical protein
LSAAELEDDVVHEVCEKHGIGGDDVFLVRALLNRKKSGWPGCCGAGCSPCMDNVTAAAEELLELRS